MQEEKQWPCTAFRACLNTTATMHTVPTSYPSSPGPVSVIKEHNFSFLSRCSANEKWTLLWLTCTVSSHSTAQNVCGLCSLTAPQDEQSIADVVRLHSVYQLVTAALPRVAPGAHLHHHLKLHMVHIDLITFRLHLVHSAAAHTRTNKHPTSNKLHKKEGSQQFSSTEN